MSRKYFFQLALFSCSMLTSYGGFAGGVVGNESYQRYMIFHNDYDRTVYPIVKVGEDDNCATKPKGKGYMRRLFVNYEGKGSGVPPKKSVKVLMPDHCWYNAGRVLVLDVPIEKYETLLSTGQKTVPWDGESNKDICVSVDGKTKPQCFWGFAKEDYPLDTPMQLLEYTFDSDDPATGAPPVDNNFDQGIPQVDVDVSGVDSLYLPAAIAVDAPNSPYLGTIMGGSEFHKRVAAFIEEPNLPKDKKVINWPAFSAYTKANWASNLFHNFATPPLTQNYNVPGGEKFVALTTWSSISNLYKRGGMAYMVDGTTSTTDSKKGSSEQVKKLYSRWKKWIDEDPCTAGEIGKITTWPAHVDGKFDKKDFCDAFRDTVRYIWSLKYPVYSKEEECIKREINPNFCVMRGIIGYERKAEEAKEQAHEPRSVQAMMRSVPHGHFSKKGLQYHLDKWLLFWAPYDSIFNLNPYTRLIHNEFDGVDSFAYSFSIDDKYGNYRNKGTGFIVDMGGSNALPLKRMYDPYHRYQLSLGTGAKRWKKIDVCGTLFEGTTGASILMPESKNGNPPECEITVYGDDKLFVKVLAVELPKTVTDLYTGQKQTVMGIELKNHPTYCGEKSSPELKQVCSQIKVTPRITDAAVTDPMKDDTIYVNVATEELPGANVIFPDLPDVHGEFYWPDELEYSTEGGNWAFIDWSPAMVKGSSNGITYQVKINPLKPPMEIVHNAPDIRAKIRQLSSDPKQVYGVEVVPAGNGVPAGSRKTVSFAFTTNMIWDRYRDVPDNRKTANSAEAVWHVARTNRSADRGGIVRKYQLSLKRSGSSEEVIHNVALDPNFSGNVATYPLKDLLPDTEYTMVIKAINPSFPGVQNDIFADPFNFKTKGKKPTASIVWDNPNLMPAPGSVIPGGKVNLKWNKATIENGDPSMSISYAVKVNGVVKGSVPSGDQQPVQYQLTGLKPNSYYDVEVEAVSSMLKSPEPAKTNFRTSQDKPTQPLLAPTITFTKLPSGKLNVRISAARGGKLPHNYQYQLVSVASATVAGRVPRKINPGVIQVTPYARKTGPVVVVVEVKNGNEKAVARGSW